MEGRWRKSKTKNRNSENLKSKQTKKKRNSEIRNNRNNRNNRNLFTKAPLTTEAQPNYPLNHASDSEQNDANEVSV